MPKLKYVGLKRDGETAFKDQTGITWLPGTVKTIADPALAQRMLRHDDVFARADDNEPEADGREPGEVFADDAPRATKRKVAAESMEKDEPPKETQVSGNTDPDAITLAPGGTVTNAPAATPAPTPAPTKAPAAPAKKAAAKTSTKAKK